MAWFWIANLVVWGVVAAVAARGALAAAFGIGTVRLGDPMRLATFLVALLFVGQVLRWLLAPNDSNLWKALYIVGVLTGCYVVRLLFAYGRGNRV